MPMHIEPNATRSAWLLIDDFESSLTCNDYARDNGLSAVVRHLYGEPTVVETKVKVPYANDCEVGLPPEPEG